MEEGEDQSAARAGASMSQKELREARRRKIMERGIDRLAYITGEVKTLPPPVATSSSSSSQLQSPAGPLKTGETGLKSLSNPGELPALEHASTSDPPTPSTSFDAKDISQKLSNVRAELQSLDDSAEPETAPLLPPPSASTSTPALSTSQQQNDSVPPIADSSASSSTTIWSNLSYVALSKSIDHTVTIRATLALLLALVLAIQLTYSQCEPPRPTSYVPRWPISSLLLTDAAVAVGALLLGFVEAPKKEKTTVDRGGLAVFRESRLDQILAMSSQLEGTLDLGLLLMKAGRGLVADVCIYIVALVCAASLTEYFRPSFCAYTIR